MDIEGLQRLFDWLVSRRTILWIFASSVFGAYVVSLEAALLESVDYYGPMRVFTTAQLANMVLPVQIAIFVWIVGSGLLLCGQLKPPRDRGDVLFGLFSLVISIVAYGTIVMSLSDVKVPWFVGYLGLTPTAKLIVGIVSGVALAYVISSPLVWRGKTKQGEIGDDLRNLVVAKARDELGSSLEIDRARMRVRNVSLLLRMSSLEVHGSCNTRDGKGANFICTFNFSRPKLESVELTTVTRAEG